jgi:hypothetical protein
MMSFKSSRLQISNSREVPNSKLRRSLSAILSASIFFVTSFAAQSSETNASLNLALRELSRAREPIPFRDVVAATTHFHVLNFETNNPAHVDLRAKILRAAMLAGERIAKDGIEAARANEAGNHIEPFVRTALREAGLQARVPVNTAGDAQITGYPDVEITAPTPCYLELKTYNATTANTTQRTFYYSPSEHPKITRDALHFLLAYELEKVSRDGKMVFIPVRWKLITLEDLLVELKFEFNQSNRGLYGAGASKALLSEGEIK